VGKTLAMILLLKEQLFLLTQLSCPQREGEIVPVAMEACWLARKPEVWLPCWKK